MGDGEQESRLGQKPSSPKPPPLPTRGCFSPRKSFREEQEEEEEEASSTRRGYSSVTSATRELWDKLFKEAYLADICITTNGDTVIPAHASILGMASPVLKNMLKHSKGRGYRRSISIRGVPHQAVRAFVRFLYSSCYEEEEMNKYVLHLLVLSHVFAIPNLKKVCTREMEKGLLKTESVIDILQLARLCDVPRLSLLCHRMIAENLKAVSSTEGWKVMKQSNPLLEQELVESVVEAHTRKEERMKKTEERKIYLQLHEAMEALVHICRDGCRSIGPHDKVLNGNRAACNFPACKGLESLVRHFAACRTRVPGGCVHCKRMWQLLELHSRMCNQPDLCRVPLCRHFKEKIQQQNKRDEVKWELLVSKVLGAKNVVCASSFSSSALLVVAT